MKNTQPVRVRFGIFELDPRSGELYVGDEKMLLGEQALQILLMLAEREGEVVTREEVRKKLWPNDTIVEFDHSINAAIGKLRKALGDSADEPQYVETLARRGYRLLVPVEWVVAVPTLSPKAGDKGGAPAGGGQLPEPTLTVRMPSEAATLTGRTVSHYRVLDIIGGGGMGVVYRAEDVKLGRRVALKFLPEELMTDSLALQRFEREAQTASSLDHPNICDIYEFGEHEGRPFIVMPFLEGRTLRDHLALAAEERRALPLTELLDIAIQVSDGLQAAHDKGIIHRDIKPANIFLTRKRLVKLLDFGLAKLLEAEASGLSPAKTASADKNDALNGTPQGVPLQGGSRAGATLTRAGLAMGTAGYMSPEQVRGEKLDARTDIFSFGLVLYEMATGQRAFTGETEAILHDAILKKPPVPLRELNSTLPAELVTTIDKCLEKDRELRYSSAAELQAELESCGSDSQFVRPQVAGGDTPGTLRHIQAPPQPGHGLAEALEGEAPGIRSLAVLPLQNLSGDPEQEYFADGLTEALIINLAKIRALRVVSRTTAMSYKGVHRSVPEIGRGLGVDAVVEGTVLRSGERVRLTVQLIHASSDMHLWAESYERALRDVLSLQAELTQAVAKEIQVQLTPKEKALFRNVQSVDPEAYESYLRGRYYLNKRGEEMLKKGIRAFQLAITKDPAYAPPYTGLADCLAVLGLFAFVSPADGCGRAKQLALVALELDPGLAQAHASLGFSLQHYDFDLAGAETELRRAIEIDPVYEIAHIWLAANQAAMGRFEEAIAEANHAVRLDPLSRAINSILAQIYWLARRYDEVIVQAKKALEVFPHLPLLHLSLGYGYLKKGQYESAIEEVRTAVELSKNAPNFLTVLAETYAIAGRDTEARRGLEKLRELSGTHYVTPYILGRIHAALQEKDQALNLLEVACQEHEAQAVYLKVDPHLDSLRSEPRFQDLVRRINYPH